MSVLDRLAVVIKGRATEAVAAAEATATSLERAALAEARLAVATAKLEQAQAKAALVAARAAADTTAEAVAKDRLAAANLRVAESSAAQGIAKAGVEVAAAQRGLEGLTAESGKATGALASLGTSGAAGPVAAAAAIATAGAAVAKFGESSIGKFAELGNEVDRYQDLAGGTSEQASEMVVTFHKLGVETEAGAKSMAFLGREVAGGNTALAKYGIQVAKNADGTTDLNGTLLNVADAYQRTGDQAEKDAILMAAFGRQGTVLTDVLEKGSTGLKGFFQAAHDHGEIFHEEDKNAAVEFTRDIVDLKEAFNGIEISAGKELIPLATMFVRANAKLLDFINGLHAFKVGIQDALGGIPIVGPLAAGAIELLDRKFKGLKKTVDDTVPSLESAADQLKTNADVLGAATDAVDSYESSLRSIAKAQQAVTEAAGAQARKEADIAKAVQDGQRATEDLSRAEETLADARRNAPRDLVKAREDEAAATHSIADADDDLAVAVAKYGVQSRQAADAADKLAQAKEAHADAQDKLNSLEQHAAHPLAVQDAERAVADAKERQAAAAQAKTKADQEDPVAEQAAAEDDLRQADEARDQAWLKILDNVNAVNAALGTQYTVQDAIDGKLRGEADKIAQIKRDAADAAASVKQIIDSVPAASQGVATVIAGAGRSAPTATTGAGAVGSVLQGQPTNVQIGPNIFNTVADAQQINQELAWLGRSRGAF